MKLHETPNSTVFMGAFGSKPAVIKMTRHPAQDEHYSKEEDILLDLSHPNVVRVYGSELENASGALKLARQSAHLRILSTTSQRVAENASQNKYAPNVRSRAFSATHFADEHAFSQMLLMNVHTGTLSLSGTTRSAP